KLGGISGFPKRAESPHDAFDTGHASTSISAAIGMLRADAMLGRERYVAAIVGDGALTGGLCFEALNDAGQSKLPLIVVINDNAMSIAHNVGAVSRHLGKIRTSGSYQRFKSFVADTLNRIPKIGQGLANRVLRFKNRIKYLLLPNVLFEEMGFTYLGPVDGHDVNFLVRALEQAKALRHPVIVHAITVKGKGYGLAESDPEKFHGIGAFDPRTGACGASAGKSNSAVFAHALVELAEHDGRIAAITAAMSAGTGLDAFARKYPARFFDVGIAEEHAVTMAAGMASAGAKPVVAIYSSFLQRAYDQIIHDVCLQELPVVFAIDRAGLVGEDGETHHGVYDMSYLRNLPNMTIMAPSTREELAAMLAFALTLDAPSALRYNRGSLRCAPLAQGIALGEWETLAPPQAVTIVAEGRMVETALRACEGLSVGIVSARFIRPLDGNTLAAIQERTKIVITLEDGVVEGGLGTALREHFEGNPRVIALGIPKTPVPQATIAEQDEMCGISPDLVRQRVMEALEAAR
ncbi:MAG TPA: 1-deoxy-D-xylulose-5-phosphate synthase, partial [Clostridia bacterium]|nr:1-deoxy-D-xylulose-5-phosphate synthase [Clostridia bacterium]